jgi:acyl transferase domain-containing protein
MVALAARPEEAQELASRFRGLEVVAVNGPNAVVLAGPDASTDAFTSWLRDQKRHFHLLPMPFAFHSASVDAVTSGLQTALNGLAAARGHVPIWSTRTGARIEGTELDAAYFAAQARETVRFHAAIDDMIARGHTLFVEVGPHPALSGDVAEALAACGASGRVITTARRGGRSSAEVARVIAESFAAGGPAHPLATSTDERIPALSLPLHPFRVKRHYWTGAPGHPPLDSSSEDAIRPKPPSPTSAQDLIGKPPAFAVAPAAEAPRGEPAPSTAAEKRDWEAIVLAIVADKTGYPADMLGMDMELESGLGIDSVMRIEILAALRGQFPDLPDVDLKPAARLRTLRDLVLELARISERS